MYQVDQPIAAREELRRGVRPLEIELAIPCAKCGYVLAGLKTNGRCPECGAAIVAAVLGDRLEYAAPGYVRKLWIGAWIGRVVVGIMLGMFVVAGIPVLVCGYFLPGIPPRWVWSLAWTTFVIAPGVAWVAGLGAWWLMATPDPARVGGAEDLRVRRWLRAVIVVQAACWAVSFGLGLGGMLGNVPPSVYLPLAWLCGFVGPAALLVHVLLASRYVRAMGARMRGVTVEELCTAHAWGAWASAAVVGMLLIGIAMRSEGVVKLAALLVFIALCVQAWLHLSLMSVVRTSAAEARMGTAGRSRWEVNR